MIKIVIISIFAIALVMFAMRLMPKLRFFIQRLLQNPLVRAILFRGLWRLIRVLIFWRYWRKMNGQRGFMLQSWTLVVGLAEAVEDDKVSYSASFENME